MTGSDPAGWQSEPMRVSSLFGQTLRAAPSEVGTAGLPLLWRGGFVRQAGGALVWLPLGQRALAKLEALVRREMTAFGAQELRLPTLIAWQGSELAQGEGRLPGIYGRREVAFIAELARQQVRSYRQLPQRLFSIAPSPLIFNQPTLPLPVWRETLLLKGYLLYAEEGTLEEQAQVFAQTIERMSRFTGLPLVLASTGERGNHEWFFLHPEAREALLICPSCGYRARQELAAFRKTPPPAEAPLPIEVVPTPGCKSIEQLATYLAIPTSRTAKVVLLRATVTADGDFEERTVFALVRGDSEVSLAKLARCLGAYALRPATEEEIRAAGAVPGYASPIGLPQVLTVVDDWIPLSPNLVAGANQEGAHVRNTNYGRDYTASLVADIALARAGDPCPRCAQPLQAAAGVGLAAFEQVAAPFGEAQGAHYLDAEGNPQPIGVALWRLDLQAWLFCVALARHDEYGVIWPPALAPFDVHVVALAGKGGLETLERAEQLAKELAQGGFQVLLDDRSESPGVKFTDADLIGLPLRLTVSERSLQAGGVEAKVRHRAERTLIPWDEVCAYVPRLLQEIQGEVANLGGIE